MPIETNADLTVNNLMAEARRRTNLADFGPEVFLEPLSVLVDSMREEAQLSPAGLAAQSERLINALSNRLRKQQLLREHPEIGDEQVEIAAAIVGLPRTGSTMLHRLLAASPQLTATRWWEAIFPLPFAEEENGSSELRRARAAVLAAQIVSAAKGFEAIHPLDADAYDEELPLLEQTFVSTLPESMMYLPTYGAWLAQADPRPAYREFIDYLKILQWQSSARRGRRWVLKAPSHLQYTPAVLELFPRALIVMTHRPVKQLMPSWYSMVGSLTGADASVDHAKAQATHWTWRWADSLKVMMRAREAAPERFLDVDYRRLMAEPLAVGEEVFRRAGLVYAPEDEAALRSWMAQNPRDNRPSHTYALADYDVAPRQLDETFGFYTREFPEMA